MLFYILGDELLPIRTSKYLKSFFIIIKLIGYTKYELINFDNDDIVLVSY
jgi:hypothetical protein